MLLSPRLQSATVIRLFGPRNIGFYDLAAVYRRLDRIAGGRGCRRGPNSIFLRGRYLNAFAVGNRKYSAIELCCVPLTMRELLAVLAHDFSQIANNDTCRMQLANTISRFTRIMSLIGIAIVVIRVPIVLIGEVRPYFQACCC